LLVINLLGTPEVTVFGHPIVVDTRKAIALLAYMTVERTATRDTLAGLFWGESSPDRARATLRRTLSALRSATGPDLIEADRSTVSLVGEVDSDIDTLDTELEATTSHGHDPQDVCPRCIPHLRRVTDLYRGEFLQGFSVRASPEFDDWVRSVTESLRMRIGATFHRLGMALAASGDYPAAISGVSKWIELDPLHEPSHRFLMLLHAWAGDRPGAIEAYRRCASVLHQELGVPPLEETTELYEAILDEDLPPAPGARRRIKATIQERAHKAELIDRATELDTLRDELESSAESGRVVALTGTAWMGKTRLLEELAAEANRQNRDVLLGRCFPMEQALPYGVVAQVLRSARPRIESIREAIPAWAQEEMARLLPELGINAQPANPDRFGELRLFESIYAMLSALAAKQPLVVLLDDVQWIDSPSAAAFSYLARRDSAIPLLMVASARPGAGLAPAIIELIGGADRSIALEPLTIEHLTPLVGDEVGAQRLLDRTGGVPLLVLEALSSGGKGESGTPGVLRYLESRLRDVGDLGRQVLTAAAVLDGTCDAALLRETSGRSEEEVVEAVEELVSAGLIREMPGSDSLGFTLDALETLVYDSISLVRRRLLHRRAARALAESGRAATDARLAAAIAGHHNAAGDPEAAPWYRTAGDMAKSEYAHEAAREFYEAALALGDQHIAETRLALGELAMSRGDYDQARQELILAASQADPATIATIEHRIGEVERLLGRFRIAEQHYQRALDAGGEEAEVLADWALLAHRTGNTSGAIELADTARLAAEARGVPRLLSRVHNILGVVTPDRTAALEHLDEALRCAGDDELLRMAALNNQALVLSGDDKRASAIVLDAISIARRTGHRHHEAALWNHLADIHHRAGREEEAGEALTRSVSIFADVDSGEMEPELWLLSRW
jgi:DNA-binding SARP family transcriptional activator